MGLDVIEEKNLNDVITYVLDYPRMVLIEARLLVPQGAILGDFAYGLYVGYISGVFFDGFLKRNNRFLNDDELSDFHAVLFKRSHEILLKIKAHLQIK
jgi:hypothetical protein